MKQQLVWWNVFHLISKKRERKKETKLITSWNSPAKHTYPTSIDLPTMVNGLQSIGIESNWCYLPSLSASHWINNLPFFSNAEMRCFREQKNYRFEIFCSLCVFVCVRFICGPFFMEKLADWFVVHIKSRTFTEDLYVWMFDSFEICVLRKWSSNGINTKLHIVTYAIIRWIELAKGTSRTNKNKNVRKKKHSAMATTKTTTKTATQTKSCVLSDRCNVEAHFTMQNVYSR